MQQRCYISGAERKQLPNLTVFLSVFLSFCLLLKKEGKLVFGSAAPECLGYSTPQKTDPADNMQHGIACSAESSLTLKNRESFHFR